MQITDLVHELTNQGAVLVVISNLVDQNVDTSKEKGMHGGGNVQV